MPNSRHWQQSGVHRGWAGGFAARSMAPSVARTASPFSEMASRTIPATWSDWEWSVNEVGGVFEGASGQPVTHNARSAGLRPFVDANIKKSEAGDRVQKLQQALNILGDTGGPEVDGLRAVLKRAETAAQGVPVDKQVKEGLRFVLVQGASTFGGTRTEAVCSRSQHQCCRAEVGHSEEAARLRATPTTGHQCRGAKITGFGESFASTSAWWRSRHALWTRCQTSMSFGTGSCSCACHPSRVERVVGGARCRSPRCVEDNGRVLELTSLLSEGAERLVELTGGMCPHIHEDECKVWSPCFSSWGGVEPRPTVD